MDGAAKKVNKLVQRVLPERPHHLSVSPTRRYPVPTSFWQHNSRLQYSTYVSEADRGVLLTRPYYEIREEPDTSAPSLTNPATRADPKKTVTKMSFKDYQQSKQKKMSESPPDTGPNVKIDARHSHGTDSKSLKEAQRIDGSRPRDLDGRQEPKPSARGGVNGDSSKSSASKVLPRPAQSPSTDNRKRAADSEDSNRPQKRTKSESFSKVDASRSSQPESQRSRDDTTSQEKAVGKEARACASQPTTNGRSLQGINKDGGHVSSPKPGVNGVKSHPAGSNPTTPKKGDGTSKPSLPPLLSPLRLAFDEQHDTSSQSPRKRPPDGGTHLKPPAKIVRVDAALPKKQKSPLRVPPLLSPTLPPIVEQELSRIKRTPSKGDTSQRGSQASESPSSGRKARAPADGLGDEEKKSCLVMLKFKQKTNVKRVKQLLALEPASKKEAMRKERSMSVEGTPPARKRPAPADPSTELTASKRPKTASEKTISVRPAAPSTPLKTTAMSRAASSNSQAETPGDTTGLTPGGNERPPTSHNENLVNSTSTSARQRFDQHVKLGTKLKHDRDAIVKSRVGNGTARGEVAGQLSTIEKKLVAALSLEMFMSYMIAFKSLNQARAMDRKPADLRAWEDLLPHLSELRSHTRHFKPLEALTSQLHAVWFEQFLAALSTHEASVVASKLLSATKKRGDAWADAHHCVESIGDSPMKVTIGPWHSVEDAVRAMLPVLHRWADRENVGWEQKISLPQKSAKEATTSK